MDEKAENLHSAKIDVVELLVTGKSVQITPSGYSMYPFLVSGRDYAILSPVHDSMIEKNQVCLYRRDDGKLVLHRVHHVDEDGVYMIGDYQQWLEGPLRREQFIGVLSRYIRKGKEHTVTEWHYQLLSRIWLLIYPKRQFLIRNMRRVCKLLRIPVVDLTNTPKNQTSKGVS